MVEPNFELGPTYEEELALRAEAEKQQQQAIAQQIFDQNMQVLEEIDRMYGPSLASEGGSVAEMGAVVAAADVAPEILGVIGMAPQEPSAAV